MKVTLPKKCFISHSYVDAAVRDRLIATLPAGAQPIIFPPITVEPNQFVSNTLIRAILECDGLIYLNGGYSERSFWVAFERDYALRLGKQVFSADAKTLEIVPHSGRPLDLVAFASYQRQDAAQVREIADFLNRERHFDLWLDIQNLQAGVDFAKEIEHSLEDRLNRGGYAVVFWSGNSSRSEYVNAEIEHAAKGISGFNDRVLFALLENVPLPPFWSRFQEPGVQLYGDAERSLTQRMDDLVVRLYWLMYRKTKHNHLDNVKTTRLRFPT